MTTVIRTHDLPRCAPWEYYCEKCETLNLALVLLTHCPICGTLITIKGNPGEIQEMYTIQIYEKKENQNDKTQDSTSSNNSSTGDAGKDV